MTNPKRTPNQLYVRTNKEISVIDRGLPYTIGNIPMLLRLVSMAAVSFSVCFERERGVV